LRWRKRKTTPEEEGETRLHNEPPNCKGQGESIAKTQGKISARGKKGRNTSTEASQETRGGQPPRVKGGSVSKKRRKVE